MDEILNTVGETGENSQNTTDYDLLIKKAAEIVTAQEAKKAKVEKSIEEDNLKHFSDEEGKILRELIEAQKNKAKHEAEKKEKEKDDLINKLREENASYKDKERKAQLNDSLATIYEELNIVEEGSKKQAQRLVMAGTNVNEFFKEDGTVDIDKVKKAFEDVIADIPSLASAKKPEIQIKETKHDETDEAVEKRKQARLKKWGLDGDNNEKKMGTTPSGFKSRLL